jgi:hypothetical protein
MFVSELILGKRNSTEKVVAQPSENGGFETTQKHTKIS